MIRSSEATASDPPSATRSAFGRYLRRARTAADLTQEDLAERAGVSARLVSDLERGVILRPRRDTVGLLADGLNLSGAERESFVALARGRSGPEPAPRLADATHGVGGAGGGIGRGACAPATA